MKYQAFPLTELHVQTLLEAIKEATLPDVKALCGMLSEFDQRVNYILTVLFSTC